MAESFVENDALPEEPRPLSVQNEPQTVVQPTHTQESEALELAIQQDFQAPTGAWEFNRMLLKLSEELTDDNLEKLKFRFSGGEGGLGKGVQEQIKKPIELFRILQERHWLTSDNLLKLQAALRDIGRRDLVRVTAEYAQKIDNVLYFYQPSETVNGYRSVKLHLCNCNYENTHRNHIQMIRTKFSELVGCALEEIVIVGLEPATSLILTFHVPESYVCMFEELLKMSTCKASLKEIGIDMVEIEGEDELYHCSGQPNKKSGYDSIPHAESDSSEVKRTDLPEVRGMYQHLEFDPKRIADKTESESKREHTVLYKRKKDADPDTKTEQQSQEILERKQILLEIHDTFVPSPENDVVKGFVYEQQV